jgi:tetratricopeptide (TPR) repeat protein
VRAGLLLAVVLALGCSRARPEPGWPATAAALHAEADRFIDSGDRAAARRALETIVATAPDSRLGETEETRRVLLQDTRFRLARLALDAKDPAEAARQAEAGLALGDEPSLFVANLLVARGAAQEALGKAAAAVDDYQRALEINESLLHETLPAP